MNFVKDVLSFIGGYVGSLLITQGNGWAVLLVTAGFILSDQMPRKN